MSFPVSSKPQTLVKKPKLCVDRAMTERRAALLGLQAGVLDHLLADAPVVVEGHDVERADLGQLGLVRIEVERDAGDDVLVDLEDEELVDVLLDRLLRAVDELLAPDGVAGQVVDQPDVPLRRLADLLVVVAVDERCRRPRWRRSR